MYMKHHNGRIKEKEEKIMELYFSKGKNMSLVAKEINCSVPSIKKILNQNGLSTSKKGQVCSQQTKDKIKKNHWSRNEETREKIIEKSNTPKKSERIRKMKIGRKRPDLSLLNQQKRGRKQTEKYIQFRKNQVLPLKDSSIEVKLQNFLKQLNIEFFTHQYMHIEHGYQCDILIPSRNLVIECDGTYWHSYPTGREIDHIRTKELIGRGFKVLRLWEFEINEMTIKEFMGVLNGRYTNRRI